ncbi:c-type cytochrome [Oceaniglobus roseus]|uniref:c-type cytochrome n=1 Tax=Oceaniglobus roseus TaxID=1737570 RepID=UPI000C7F6068|nr:c-type cytochrome [Kandeliimicrobium roseum]
MSKSRETVKILVPALLGTTALLGVAFGLADRMIHAPSDGQGTAAGRVVAAVAAVEHAVEDALVPAASAEEHAVTPADEGEDFASLSRDGGFGLGRAALPEEVAAWDIDVRPDGQGLPRGSGDVATGEEIWVETCAMCHGDFGEAVGRWPQIAGGWDTLNRKDPVKTVGSYWPYLSTVIDYVHRAMPFGNAQSLEPDQVYALTAYILYLNNVVDEDFVLSDQTFAEVKMPNADGFFMDDRPETELKEWTYEPCMENCKEAPAEIVMRAAVLDVTPGTDEAAGEGQREPATTAAAEPETTAGPADTAPEAAAATEGSAGEDVAAVDPALAEAGEKVFRKCQACHAVGEGAKNKVGPQLNGVLGRGVGSIDGFNYSPAFREAYDNGEVWTADRLSAFLENPRDAMPGTKMSYRGLPDAGDRDALIAFLASHGD